ncbi:MAG: DUF1997 domain-containing protein [Microcoleaceae cyanobacterium MO_207.B10]|nr:DUF1997 domain-containing protein [Microcoleaceae cyanobacterium MO_207.B10]
MHNNLVEAKTLQIDKNLITNFYLDATELGMSDTNKTTLFHTQYSDCMELYADVQTVAKHFASHRSWFCRCAAPMKVEPLGENGYDLLIGKFGSFGYQVEARVGLELVPPDSAGIYKIRTIPVPGYTPPGYEVNFESEMRLVELATEEFCSQKDIQKLGLPPVITGAKWDLNLTVGVQFPNFIRKMSPGLIQNTGDRLLLKVVQQVSRCLSYKTQIDFHTTYDLPFPKQRKRR